MANVPIRIDQGGKVLTIGAGGTLATEAGSTIDLDGATLDIGDDSITTAMLQDDCVTNPKIAAGAVDTNSLDFNAVESDNIAAGAVDNDALGAGSVTKAKTAMFISATQTGDGMNEDLAHSLGADPTTANVFISVMDTLTNTVGDFNASIVSTDATNVTVNVTTGVLYRVMAWAP